MKHVIAIVLVLTSMAATGQTDSLKTKPVRYAFTLNSGMLFCPSCTIESSTVGSLTTVHGIKWKRLRVGGGLGYSSFGPIRVMPIFGSVSVNLFGKKAKSGLFTELNYGGAHSWLAAPMRNGEFLKDVSASNFVQFSAGYAFHYYGLRVTAQVGVHSLEVARRYEIGNEYEYNWGLVNYIIPPQEQLIEYNTTRPFISISVGF